jgi:nitrate reductase beta subunit
MARVFNWQIGREMEYWYAGARPKKQFGAIFDTNKCIACQTCTVACKTTWTTGRGQEYMLWNNVETKPRGGFPMTWDLRVLDLLKQGQWDGRRHVGKTIFESAPLGERVLGWRPSDLDYAHPNIGEDEVSQVIDACTHYVSQHVAWMFYLARICNHCTYPACLSSCPRGAIYKRPEDGIVLVDQRRCRGYQECVKACPYKKVFYNAVEGVSQKCIGCFPKIERGEQPQCFVNCIGKIRLQGWIHPPESIEEDNPVDYLVHVRKLALPLLPQLGLEPNVYYVPPVHVPMQFLVQMFGPAAPKAVETYRHAADDKTLAGLFALFGCTKYTICYFKILGDEAIAYNQKREEVIRVPIYEPIQVRLPFDETLQIARTNIP